MKSESTIVKTILSILVCLVFFSSLIFFLVSGVLEEDRKISQTENRMLMPFPELSFSTVADGSFMEDIEQYMSDQFCGRDTIVSARTVISRLLGKKEINGVYLGSDNRLLDIPTPIDPESMEDTLSAINEFSEKIRTENKYFVLVPNATEICAEYLPKHLKLLSQEEQIAEIYSALNADITKIDATGVLKDADNAGLYFRTDHHWTSDAAFLVFDEFMNTAGIDYDKNAYNRSIISNSFFGTLSSSSGIYEIPDEISVILPANSEGKYYLQNFDTEEKTVSVIFPEKLEERNHYEVFFGGNFSKIEIHTDNLNSQKLLVIKDSYANCFVPLLIPYFEKIVIIDPRYFSDDLKRVTEDDRFTHLLFLYNLNTFAEDTVLAEVLRGNS